MIENLSAVFVPIVALQNALFSDCLVDLHFRAGRRYFQLTLKLVGHPEPLWNRLESSRFEIHDA